MRLIVDREQLVQQVFAGNGRVGNDLYSPLDAGYLSEAPQRTQDIERAKALLAEAGQSDLTLDLASVFLDPAIPAMVQVFAQQAAEAGVTINVQNMTPDQFFSTAVLPGAAAARLLVERGLSVRHQPRPMAMPLQLRVVRRCRVRCALRRGSGSTRRGPAYRGHEADAADPVRSRQLRHLGLRRRVRRVRPEGEGLHGRDAGCASG